LIGWGGVGIGGCRFGWFFRCGLGGGLLGFLVLVRRGLGGWRGRLRRWDSGRFFGGGCLPWLVVGGVKKALLTS